MGLTLRGVSQSLKIARNTAANYSSGSRVDSDKDVEVPYVVLLACSALERGIPPVKIENYIKPEGGDFCSQ